MNPQTSYPISVGLVTNGRSYYWEIAPKPEWTDWSKESERVHGLTLEHLHAQGLPAEKVLQQVRRALNGCGAVYSDCPHWESTWAAVLGLDLDVRDVRSIIGQHTEEDLAEYVSHAFALGGLQIHHAEGDAIALALAVSHLRALTAQVKSKEDWESFFYNGPDVTEDFERPEQGGQPLREEL